MASSVKNNSARNYQNLLIILQGTIDNVGNVFLRFSVYFNTYFA